MSARRHPPFLVGSPAASAEGTQLLVDLSVLVHEDDKSGVQRLVRNVVRTLLAAPPAGFRVEPVYDAGGYYAYARQFILGSDAAEARGLDDAPIRVAQNDVFLGLDLAPNHVPDNRALLESLRLHGVKMYFVVYDLLPIKQPGMFVAGAQPWFERWLTSVASVADGLLCISRSVADEVLDWLDANPAPNPGTLQVGYFHLGADLDAAAPADALSAPEAAALAQLAQRPALLMVGTLEPRKMHAQALDAFESLWRAGTDASLVIVGKQGWLVDALVERLHGHPELGRRLFWLERASDCALQRLYAECSALLAASSGEGFGLPLIEAAQHALPVIARDIPVFREVAGEHAFYFSASRPDDLAAALRQWLTLAAQGSAPASGGMAWMTWEQSTRQLVGRITQGQWYRQASSRLA
jgi:glycosyltransferase involved in cell wall biosynthesis